MSVSKKSLCIHELIAARKMGKWLRASYLDEGVAGTADTARHHN